MQKYNAKLAPLIIQRSDAISRLMQSLGRRYAQYVNRVYRRSGSVWEGRFKASLIQAEEYLLTCYRYIELNPVRADMVRDPGEYRWSSYLGTGWGRATNSLQTTPYTRRWGWMGKGAGRHIVRCSGRIWAMKHWMRFVRRRTEACL